MIISSRHLRNAAAVLFFAVLVGSNSEVRAAGCVYLSGTYPIATLLDSVTRESEQDCIQAANNLISGQGGQCEGLCNTECSTWFTWEWVAPFPLDCTVDHGDDDPPTYIAEVYCICEP